MIKDGEPSHCRADEHVRLPGACFVIMSEEDDRI